MKCYTVIKRNRFFYSSVVIKYRLIDRMKNKLPINCLYFTRHFASCLLALHSMAIHPLTWLRMIGTAEYPLIQRFLSEIMKVQSEDPLVVHCSDDIIVVRN